MHSKERFRRVRQRRFVTDTPAARFAAFLQSVGRLAPPARQWSTRIGFSQRTSVFLSEVRGLAPTTISPASPGKLAPCYGNALPRGRGAEASNGRGHRTVHRAPRHAQCHGHFLRAAVGPSACLPCLIVSSVAGSRLDLTPWIKPVSFSE